MALSQNALGNVRSQSAATVALAPNHLGSDLLELLTALLFDFDANGYCIVWKPAREVKWWTRNGNEQFVFDRHVLLLLFSWKAECI